LENLKENGFFFLLEAVESKYGAKAVPFNEDMLAICICIEHLNAFQQYQFLMPETLVLPYIHAQNRLCTYPLKLSGL
jgi:hypothetical protein